MIESMFLTLWYLIRWLLISLLNEIDGIYATVMIFIIWSLLSFCSLHMLIIWLDSTCTIIIIYVTCCMYFFNDHIMLCVISSFYLAFTTTLSFALFHFTVLHRCEFNFISIHDYCIIHVVQYFSFLLFFSLFEQFLLWLPFFLITLNIWFSPSDNLYNTLLLSVLSNNIINMLTYYILIRIIEQLCIWLLFMAMWRSLVCFLKEAPEWKWRTG